MFELKLSHLSDTLITSDLSFLETEQTRTTLSAFATSKVRTLRK
jgi:hypothetical protein